MYKNIQKMWILLILSFPLIITGCAVGTNKPVSTSSPTETPLPPPATPTSLPMAVRIDGVGILLSDYQEEFQRLDSGLKTLGKSLSPDEIKAKVLDDLIGTEILNLEAKKNGYSISDDDITAHIGQLAQSIGGDDAFNAWKQSMDYSDESFRRFIIRSLGSVWQREQIIKSLPDKAEQVHARQILFIREESAVSYRQKIESGSDFTVLAKEADPVTGGELGWFPKGYLLQPEVEEAAFGLQPGEVSRVVKSAIGYHLIQVIEKDAARLVEPDAKIILQRKAIVEWVGKAKTKSQIEILIP